MAQPQPQPQAQAQAQAVPIRILTENLRSFQMDLRATALANQIRDYNGDGGRRCREWLKDVERVGHILQADNERYKTLALQSLKGAAADYFYRIIRTEPNLAWPEIRLRLVQNFCEDGDTHLALQRLRRMTQSKGESVQTFSEKLLSQAEEAYPGQDFNNPLIQNTLVECLIDGVREDALARKLIRDRPNTFIDALASATREQQAHRAFGLRRKAEEPMEVDANTVSSGLEQKLDRMTDILQEVLKISVKTTSQDRLGYSQERPGQSFGKNRPGQSFGPNRPGPNRPDMSMFKWSPDGKPICHYCGTIGHISRQCYKKKSADATRTPREN